MKKLIAMSKLLVWTEVIFCNSRTISYYRAPWLHWKINFNEVEQDILTRTPFQTLYFRWYDMCLKGYFYVTFDSYLESTKSEFLNVYFSSLPIIPYWKSLTTAHSSRLLPSIISTLLSSYVKYMIFSSLLWASLRYIVHHWPKHESDVYYTPEIKTK